MMAATGAMAWFWQAWLAATVFIFPIPHTIALRNLLLLIGVALLLWRCRTSLPRPPAWLKPAAWGLAALSAWIVLHSLAVAPAPTLALDQFRANWLMPLLLGAIASWAAAQLAQEQAARAVIAALLAHMLWLLGLQFMQWLATGSWPFKLTPFGAYDYHGTLNSFLLALLVTDRLAWLLEKHSPLALGRRAGWGALLLSLVADIALRSRNSTTIDVAVLFAACLVLLRARSDHRRAIVALVAVVALVGAGSLGIDNRWQGLRESSAIGWSSPNTYWLTDDLKTQPVTPSGAPLETSAYLRAAWAHQAIDFIAEHPLGIGFGHEAFGRAVAQKYGRTGFGSSHSGWLDFALGTGLPGLALLLFTAGLAMRGGWRQFRQHDDGVALMFSFFVGGYMLRCLLDGHLSGWRLGLFAFLCGVLIAAMNDPRRQT